MSDIGFRVVLDKPGHRGVASGLRTGLHVVSGRRKSHLSGRLFRNVGYFGALLIYGRVYFYCMALVDVSILASHYLGVYIHIHESVY